MCRVMMIDYCCVIGLHYYEYVAFNCDFLSGLVIKIEHDGEILTSFLARSIQTKVVI